MEKIRYVIDTNGLISYYSNIFKNAPDYNGSPTISKKAENTIREAICSSEGNILLSIPSIIFIEIFQKWLRKEEFSKQFFYEIFTPLKDAPNVEIRSIDKELLENLMKVEGYLENHELHDKIVVAAAMTLECPLITFDSKIIKFVEDGEEKIPYILN